jgi:hypothetical protein
MIQPLVEILGKYGQEFTLEVLALLANTRIR